MSFGTAELLDLLAKQGFATSHLSQRESAGWLVPADDTMLVGKGGEAFDAGQSGRPLLVGSDLLVAGRRPLGSYQGNPHHDRIMSEIVPRFDRPGMAGLVTSKHAMVRAEQMATVISWCHPTRTLEQMHHICMLYFWWWCLDDMAEGDHIRTSAKPQKEFYRTISSVLRTGLGGTNLADEGVEMVDFWNILDEIIWRGLRALSVENCGSTDPYDRFVAQLEDYYYKGTLPHEFCDRQGLVLRPEQFFALRLYDTGIMVGSTLVEIYMGCPLSSGTRADARFRELNYVYNLQIGCANDIYSFDRERSLGSGFNLLVTYMHHEDRTLEEAVDKAVTLCNNLADRYEVLVNDLLGDPPVSSDRDNLKKFTDAGRDWMNGIVAASQTCGRYRDPRARVNS